MMKHLANCTATEFLKQSAKLRAPFVQWLEDTGIQEIRKRKPESYETMSDDERREAFVEQGLQNMGDILDAALEKDFEGTVEIICLCCFTEVADFDSHTFPEYYEAIMEMFQNTAVRGFFTLYLKPRAATSSKG